MRTLFVLTCAGLLIAATPLAVQAKGGASGVSPGAQFRASGAVTGTHGASGYAPGTLYRNGGATGGLHGAAGYAPGHTK